VNIGPWTSRGYLVVMGHRYRMWRHPDVEAFVLIGQSHELDTVTILEKMVPNPPKRSRRSNVGRTNS
jgi:hypothetical protein